MGREVEIRTCSGVSRYVWLDGALVRLSDLHLLATSGSPSTRATPKPVLVFSATGPEVLG